MKFPDYASHYNKIHGSNKKVKLTKLAFFSKWFVRSYVAGIYAITFMRVDLVGFLLACILFSLPTIAIIYLTNDKYSQLMNSGSIDPKSDKMTMILWAFGGRLVCLLCLLMLFPAHIIWNL